MSDTALVISIIELILTQGPKIAINMMKTLDIDDPTPEDIRALKLPDPESFFEEDPE